MTQEQKGYEQKYKEALGWMQSLYKGLHGATKEDAEHYFPELKESGDERIKREILDYINGFANLKDEKIPTEWLEWLEKQGEPEDKGEISDGYHTFNELYSYRMLYNAAFFNLLPKQLVHKSKRHHDGEECFGGGWFIVMANLPTGQISNHYELKDWDLFQIPEKEIADEWDGHTPQEAAERLHKYLLEKQGKQTHSVLGQSEVTKTSDKELELKFKVGDKVVAKCNKTDVKTIEKVSQCGTYWTSSKEFSSGWWGEDELEPYVEPKMLNADKVIAWLVGNIIDFEDYVRAFKKDFGL